MSIGLSHVSSIWSRSPARAEKLRHREHRGCFYIVNRPKQRTRGHASASNASISSEAAPASAALTRRRRRRRTTTTTTTRIKTIKTQKQEGKITRTTSTTSTYGIRKSSAFKNSLFNNVTGCPSLKGSRHKQLRLRIRTSWHHRYITSWWFQPIWKILVKMGIFPK